MNHHDFSVCVVDDDISMREAIAALVRSDGFAVETFASAEDYLDTPRPQPSGCIVLDVHMPGLSGFELQDALLRTGASVPIVFTTGRGDIPMSVRALKAGAADFITKPFDANVLLGAIRLAIASGRQSAEAQPPSHFDKIVGDSSTLSDVLAQVRIVAATDSTVLIHGETGTGKELIARAVHDASDRKNGPFIKVNCGAIPAGLLESELMGHERGAFTGAIAQRIGRFELAQNGSIFLDEIGEIAVEMQPKLLRLLQEREFERVGGTRTVRTNARLIAATHCDLREMVRARTFREDLYYRLNVFPITLPPLRDRREDIACLAQHFAKQHASRLKRPSRALSSTAVKRLTEHHWPGNIRELQNVIERAVILADGPMLEVPSFDRPAAMHAIDSSREDLASVSRAHILGVLTATRWVVAGPDGAAARLGMNRSTLNFRMKKLGIERAGGSSSSAVTAGSHPLAARPLGLATFD